MKKQTIIVALIFILALGFRLFFAFQTPTLDHEAYFDLRQVESIKDTGLPIFQDELSYGGRVFHFVPVFHYILAFFSLFLPTLLVLKLVPNIMAASIVIISYFIAKRITNNLNASLFCAFISAFIPVFIMETFNSASIYAAVIPLTFLSIYFLMNISNKKNVIYFLISTFILTIIHPSSFILILGLLIYLVIGMLERLKLQRAAIESVLFLTFFSIWVNIMLYKKAFLLHGPYVIWQNIPDVILSLYFAQTNIMEAVIKIGFIPLILGIYIIYRSVLREKVKEIYLLVSLALACFFLVWLRLIQPNVAFMFLGAILIILFARGYKLFFDYLKKTKFSSYRTYFILLFILIFLIGSVVPSVYFVKQKIYDGPKQEDIGALLWIKENANKEDVIVASLKEGHMITAIAERVTMIDSDFLLINNPEQRFYDLERIFKSQYKTEAIPLLNKHNVKYLIFSDAAEGEFDINQISYIDKECFKLVWKNHTKVYESLCRVEEI